MQNKQTSKQRTNWTRQERDSKGHFMPYKKEKEITPAIGLDQLEHAFLAGLKANNSFYPPSKLWEFYKRDRGL
ncbi:MAG: hypothetical protein PHR19_02410 [Bacteroidales bacterium]|nr:hypothetical protein [Bacteroidales bacterium]